MISFDAIIEKFGKQGEKTGWTYLFIPFEEADKLNKGIRKSYRVKGTIDDLEISQTAILPMGEGNYILPLKAELRKKIKKPLGEKVLLTLAVDLTEKKLDPEMMMCLEEVPEALKKFTTMPLSHQFYYSNHVTSAKTESTKAKRIAHIITAMIEGLTFADMLKMK